MELVVNRREPFGEWGALMDKLRFYLDQAKVCADTARVSQQEDHRLALEQQRAAWLNLAAALRRQPKPGRSPERV